MGDTALVPVTEVTLLAQAAITAAPPGERRRLWDAYQAFIKDAQEEDLNRLPWEEAARVKAISSQAAKNVLVATFRLIRDEEIRNEVIHAAAVKSGELEQQPDTSKNQKPRGTRQCARPGCHETFVPAPRQIYHNANCRVAAFKARRKRR